MTQRELDKLRTINQVIDKVITVRTAAELLNLSERQVLRLKGGVMSYGEAFLIHKNRGRKPEHAISEELKETIISLKQSKYQSANFMHFREILEEFENIIISYPAVHRILSDAGIKSPKKHRKTKAHHRRKRKAQVGMLVQVDSSPHVWIEGKKPFDLHGAIDDATGKILGLYFTKNECLEGYFKVMEQMLVCHGRPINLYCDRHTIFFSPNDEKVTIEEQLQGFSIPLTQFGIAMKELDIGMIKARTAQAKGRIERLWNTLQSRLPVIFKFNNINTIDQANAFLPSFIDYFNERFAVEPEESVCAFRELNSDIDLSTVLCIKNTRTLIDRGAFSYKGLYYQLSLNGKPVNAMPKAKVTILEHSSVGIRCVYKNVVYETNVLRERPKKRSTSKANEKVSFAVKNAPPATSHPWRQQLKRKPSLPYYIERDPEVSAMLDELFSSSRAWV